mmetsp:Transcript_5478/g.10277  ORF Transcript_5478/g.10277 Transcript_5478/m.10277 type:complete len:285 (-) Transcript_5478:229-1083(-)
MCVMKSGSLLNLLLQFSDPVNATNLALKSCRSAFASAKSDSNFWIRAINSSVRPLNFPKNPRDPDTDNVFTISSIRFLIIAILDMDALLLAAPSCTDSCICPPINFTSSSVRCRTIETTAATTASFPLVADNIADKNFTSRFAAPILSLAFRTSRFASWISFRMSYKLSSNPRIFILDSSALACHSICSCFKAASCSCRCFCCCCWTRSLWLKRRSSIWSAKRRTSCLVSLSRVLNSASRDTRRRRSSSRARARSAAAAVAAAAVRSTVATRSAWCVSNAEICC